MSRGGGGDAKKKRGAEGQVLLGNRDAQGLAFSQANLFSGVI